MNAAVGPVPLTEEDGRILLALARSAVTARLAGSPPPEPASIGARLRENQGAFVTILLGGALRGCIGIVRGGEPLWRSVLNCAIAAGFEDPRFPPLEPEEEADLSFEVSVLWPPRIVDGPGAVMIGRDGLIVSLGRRQGLLLPQVAMEHGWDATRFLAETCRKAGLGEDAWTHGARIEAFEAQVFRERPRRGEPRGEV